MRFCYFIVFMGLAFVYSGCSKQGDAPRPLSNSKDSSIVTIPFSFAAITGKYLVSGTDIGWDNDYDYSDTLSHDTLVIAICADSSICYSIGAQVCHFQTSGARYHFTCVGPHYNVDIYFPSNHFDSIYFNSVYQHCGDSGDQTLLSGIKVK